VKGHSWGRVRLLAGLVVLGVLVWRVGTGPFLDGIRMVDGQTLLVGTVLAVPTTVCCAQRWRLVARSLGLEIGLPDAVAAYYRSQLLNTVLPGGVLGDLDRGLRQGRGSGDTGRGLRAVGWERLAGQVVQVATTLVVLLLVPSPVGPALPAVGVSLGVLALGCTLVLRMDPRTRGARLLRAVRSDLSHGLLSPRTWPGVTATSFVAVVGHVATFLVAAHAAGVRAPAERLLPLALLVLLAMALPLNVAGWGPREGVAAWAFAAAGPGAGLGVTTAVVYAVMVTVAALPGLVILLLGRLLPRDARKPGVPALVGAGRETARG
jgi:glycosyltransferase 2 family protein